MLSEEKVMTLTGFWSEGVDKSRSGSVVKEAHWRETVGPALPVSETGLVWG